MNYLSGKDVHQSLKRRRLLLPLGRCVYMHWRYSSHVKGLQRGGSLVPGLMVALSIGFKKKAIDNRELRLLHTALCSTLLQASLLHTWLHKKEKNTKFLMRYMVFKIFLVVKQNGNVSKQDLMCCGEKHYIMKNQRTNSNLVLNSICARIYIQHVQKPGINLPHCQPPSIPSFDPIKK